MMLKFNFFSGQFKYILLTHQWLQRFFDFLVASLKKSLHFSAEVSSTVRLINALVVSWRKSLQLQIFDCEGFLQEANQGEDFPSFYRNFKFFVVIARDKKYEAEKNQYFE